MIMDPNAAYKFTQQNVDLLDLVYSVKKHDIEILFVKYCNIL